MNAKGAHDTQNVIAKGAHHAHSETPHEKLASIGWAENAGWVDVFLVGLTNQPAFCFKKC